MMIVGVRVNLLPVSWLLEILSPLVQDSHLLHVFVRSFYGKNSKFVIIVS